MAIPPRPPGLTKYQNDFWDLREQMLYEKGKLRVKASDFLWFSVPLANGLCKIKVSYPLYMMHPTDKKWYYVPVTASETWDIAKLLGYFPLTAEVFDKSFEVAMANNLVVPSVYMSAANPKECYDFPKMTKCLATYSGHQGTFAAGGGHKLWILTAQGNSINRGFYQKNAKNPKGYSPIQRFGPGHDMHHWDYSQLLQLMGDFTDNAGGAIDIVKALQQTPPNHAIYTESTALTQAQIDKLTTAPKSTAPKTTP